MNIYQLKNNLNLKEVYSVEESLKLTRGVILEKITAPTNFDEILSKVYQKPVEQVIKDYSNSHNIPKFNPDKSSFLVPPKIPEIVTEISKNIPPDDI